MHLSDVAPRPTEKTLPISRAFATQHGVDLAIPACRGSGVGNAMIYTRLVEEWARAKGRPAKIITAPLQPKIGKVQEEAPFSIWRHNPFVDSIINADDLDPEGFERVDCERRSLIQINHIIENVCFAHGLRPRALRASLFLSSEEMKWGLEATKHIPRPLICLHPGGNTQSRPGAPWHSGGWRELVDRMKTEAGFLQIGRPEFGDQDIGLENPGRTLRQAMALIWASDAFVGFDSSPMTMATAFEKPVVALFDMTQKYEAENNYGLTYVPSVMLRWAYPQNRNIALMDNDDGKSSLACVMDALRSSLSRLTYCV